MYSFMIGASDEFYNTMESSCAELDSFINELLNISAITEDTENENWLSKIKKTLIDFIKKIHDALNDFMTNMKEKLIKFKDSQKTKNMVQDIRKRLNDANKHMMPEIDFIDVWALEKVYARTAYKASKMEKEWCEIASKGKSTSGKATSFVKEYNTFITKSQKEIDKIKSKKIKVSTEKALNWVNTNISSKGEATGTCGIYIEHIKELERTVDDISEKLEEYNEREGYISNVSSLKDAIHNGTQYVKKNYDWIGTYAVSSLMVIGAFVSNTAGALRNTRDGDMVTNDPTLYNKEHQRAMAKYHLSNDKTDKVNRLATKGLIGAATLGAASATKGKIEADKSRNNIYK